MVYSDNQKFTHNISQMMFKKLDNFKNMLIKGINKQ